MNKDAIEREVARHGDPVAYMTATAKRIDPEIDEQAFKMLLLMTTAANCDVECSPRRQKTSCHLCGRSIQ